MAIDSRAVLFQRLTEVREAISSARKTQSYSVGQDMTVSRGQLRTLLDEEKWLMSQIEKLDASASGGACNRVIFGRPA